MRKSSKPKDKVTKVLKAHFDQAHREGMKALDRHDFDRVDRSIRRERKAVEKLTSRIATQRAKFAARSK